MEEHLLKKMRNIFSEELEDEDIAEEIRELAEEGRKREVFAQDEVDMIKNVLEFKNTDARDVMTHRKHIFALSSEETLEEAVQEILGERYSRFPVYTENIDQIIGTVHIRDIMMGYMNPENRKKPITEVEGCLKPVSFIPETRNIDRLFRQMQTRKNHMAVVIDEYGQTAGIVTMEDIIEEIVGNIQDEYDEDVEEIIKRADGTYLARGIADLGDLEEILRIPFEKEDYGTLNGFLVDQLDRIPSEGEVCNVDYEGYRFRILSVDDNMIQSVKIIKQ
ncbi:MAG TPA: HlyC/CorC family transporter [Lachnospiraceae bacterium]|nr:HlyC/CorC family transporter [Lachnospiraceae bacterium]